MAIVWIPPLLRPMAGGEKQVSVSGATIAQVIEALDAKYPGLKSRVASGDRLRPGIAVAVDGTTSMLGMLEPVREDSEVEILPAISGGRARGGDRGRDIVEGRFPLRRRQLLWSRSPHRGAVFWRRVPTGGCAVPAPVPPIAVPGLVSEPYWG